MREESAAALFDRAGQVFAACVRTRAGADRWQARLDRLLAGRHTALPLMLLLLALVLFLTIAGANAPSEMLFSFFARAEAGLDGALSGWGAPAWLRGMLCAGMVRTLGWVVAVMLPPMAIFFPLFTLLEDAGYLPRVASYSTGSSSAAAPAKTGADDVHGAGLQRGGGGGLPHHRQSARAAHRHAHQCVHALQRALPDDDRPHRPLSRARGASGGAGAGGRDRAGAAATFAASRLLSSTPAARPALGLHAGTAALSRPQVGRVIVRSVVERTLRMLGRAAAVAAPAGLVIWLLANLPARGGTLLSACVAALEPLGRFLGMDGALLMAFILALPANELVLPLAMLAYASGGALARAEDMQALGALLRENGWTWLTALNAILFSLSTGPVRRRSSPSPARRAAPGGRWRARFCPRGWGAAVCALTAGLARALGLAV